MRTIRTTASLIEAMAERSGRAIELHADTAFLTIGATVWVASLPPTGGAS